MSTDGSVTGWISTLQQGDRQVGQELFQHYFDRLVRLARTQLSGLPRRESDEEDVAISAFASFFRGVERGRYPQLRDRHDLWQLLVVISEHKSIDELRRASSLKRGARQVRGESVFQTTGGSAGSLAGLSQVVDAEPTPEFAAEVAVECRRLLELLPDDSFRELAMLKMEGYTNEEIAAKLGRTRRTVQRRLLLIREIWKEQVDE